MTISRILVGAGAALFAALPSFDPSTRPQERPPRAMVPVVAVTGAKVASSPEAALVAGAAAPADLKIQIVPESGQRYRVELHRVGHLVALLHGAARAAGKDWAMMRVEPAPGKKGSDAGERLVWETTPVDGMTTARGLVSLRLSGTEMRAELTSAPAPEAAGEWSGAHHTCAAHRDGAGGFTVLCRMHHGAARVAAANVTGPRSAEGAVVIAPRAAQSSKDRGKEGPLVRLDLPLAPGVAEARVIGFTAGRAGAVIRAEASWAEGEEPALTLDEAERNQPASPGFWN